MNELRSWANFIYSSIWLWIASAFALALAVGYRDRLAAILMMLIPAAFYLGPQQLAGHLDVPLALLPAFLCMGWLLLAHAFMPPAPYGSASALNRTDPAGGWRMPPGLFLASWIVLALSYVGGGYAQLFYPTSFGPIFSETLTWVIGGAALLFAPLCLLERLRPWLWSIMLSVQIGIGLFLGLQELTISMLLLHMVTFNPLWLKPVSLKGATVFFDGTCALCHGSVRFLLSEEQEGTLQFSPLQGTLFANTVGEAQRKSLGDSFVVVTPDGEILSEADVAIYLLDAIGGLWRVLSLVMRLFPRRLRNRAYHVIGDRRYRLFGTKADLCPLTPPEMKDRILI